MKLKWIIGGVIGIGIISALSAYSLMKKGDAVTYTVPLDHEEMNDGVPEEGQQDVPESESSDAATDMESETVETKQESQPVVNEGVSDTLTQKDAEVKTETNDTKTETKKVADASSGKLNIKDKLVSFGYGVPNKTRTIDTIILHSSYDLAGNDPYSVSGVIAEWKDYGVAPHYLIARDGTVYRLVKDVNIAYHAGVSEVPDGRTNVNDFSIGIEILNTKTDAYTDAQYKAINNMIAYLKGKYSIKYVLGHDDIAPGRKTDPWNLDWKKVKK